MSKGLPLNIPKTWQKNKNAVTGTQNEMRQDKERLKKRKKHTQAY